MAVKEQSSMKSGRLPALAIRHRRNTSVPRKESRSVALRRRGAPGPCLAGLLLLALFACGRLQAESLPAPESPDPAAQLTLIQFPELRFGLSSADATSAGSALLLGSTIQRGSD